MSSPGGSLAGVRVLELGSFIAGPFAGQLLGDHGAEVVKVEAPGAGDPMRKWGVVRDGESLWWPHIARNKRSVALDLRTDAGRAAVARMAASVDVVLENFRPGTLEGWGMSYAELAAANPGVVLVHVSGYGQTGPRASEPGFGSIGEAMGGIRHTTGDPDRPSARAGVSLGDALAALFAVIGTLSALHERSSSGRGQEVDVAIYEAVAALMESSLADQHLAGLTRGRSGSVLPGVAPSNAYPTADGGSVVIAANADALYVRLCGAMGRADLATDPRFATHGDRGANMAELDELITAWTSSLPSDALLAALQAAAVPAGLIYTAADVLDDQHYQAREMITWLRNAAGVSVPGTGVVPKLSRTPGTLRSSGPALGADTRWALTTLAGLSDDEVDGLFTDGVAS